MIDPIKTPKQIALEMAGVLPHMAAGKRVLSAADMMKQYIQEARAELKRRRDNLRPTSHEPAGPFAAVQKEDYLPPEMPSVETAPSFIDRPTPSPIATERATAPNKLSTPEGRLKPLPGSVGAPGAPEPGMGPAGNANPRGGLIAKDEMAYPHMTRRGREADPFLYKEATGQTPASTTSRGGESLDLQEEAAGKFRDAPDEMPVSEGLSRDMVGSEIEGGYAITPMYEQLAARAAKAEQEGALHNYSPYDQAFLVANREALRKALGKQKYEHLMERAGLWRTGERASKHTRDVSADLASKPTAEMADAMERYRRNPRPEDVEMLNELMQGIMRRKQGGSTGKTPQQMRDYMGMAGGGKPNRALRYGLPALGAGFIGLEIHDFVDALKNDRPGEAVDIAASNAAFMHPALAGIYTALYPRDANAGEAEELARMRGEVSPQEFMRQFREGR